MIEFRRLCRTAWCSTVHETESA